MEHLRFSGLLSERKDSPQSTKVQLECRLAAQSQWATTAQLAGATTVLLEASLPVVKRTAVGCTAVTQGQPLAGTAANLITSIAIVVIRTSLDLQ